MADQKAVTRRVVDNAEVERLRADIATTRLELGHTIDAIQERLSPERIKQEAKDSVREATIGRVKQMVKNAGDKASDKGRGILEVMRDNPVPLAMIGLGAGWLLMKSRRRQERVHYMRSANERVPIGYESGYPGGGERPNGPGVIERAREEASDAAETVGEKVSDAGTRLKSAAEDVTQRVSEVASEVSERVSEKVSDVSDRGERELQRARYTYEETPWVGAAVALALGAAAGLSIPSTWRERELIGEKRSELLDRVRETGREKLEAVRNMAEEVIDDVKPVAEQSLREHAREEGLTSDASTEGETNRYM
jgi:ElaB/YqjD/DUF883 family membrane-anchored ribosome-binding protein